MVKKQRRQVVASPTEIAATLLADYRRQIVTLGEQGGQEATIALVERLIERIAGQA